MKHTEVLMCHPILYSFVSWRAGGCWGGGETRIPRLNVQQEEKREARKGCKGGGEGLQEAKARAGKEVKARGLCSKFSRSIQWVQMRRM